MSQTKDPRKPLLLNIAAQIAALAVAGYLIYHHYSFLGAGGGDFHSFCAISERLDCDVVNTSSYSEFLGVPLSVWSFGYSLLAILLSILAMGDLYSRRETLLLLVGFGGFSLAASVWLLGVQLYALKTTCILCVSLYFLNAAAFLASYLAWRRCRFTRPYFAEWRAAKPRKLAGYLVMGAVLTILTHALTSQLSTATPLEKERFLTEFRSQPAHGIDPGTSPRMGFPGDAPPVRIVEFSDFQCPHCAVAAKQLHLLLRQYSDRIQLVFKNYPLDPACNPRIKGRLHNFACLAARATLCASRLGIFEKYFTKVFENQSLITDESLRAWARELGASIPDFDRCVASSETAEELRKDIELADSLGLQATPTFFVNGRKVEGTLDLPRMRLILKELEQL